MDSPKEEDKINEPKFSGGQWSETMEVECFENDQQWAEVESNGSVEQIVEASSSSGHAREALGAPEIIDFCCRICCATPVIVPKGTRFEEDSQVLEASDDMVPICNLCVEWVTKMQEKIAFEYKYDLQAMSRGFAFEDWDPESTVQPVRCSVCCKVVVKMSQGETLFCDWRNTLFRYANVMTCVCFLCEGNLHEMRGAPGIIWHHPITCICQGRGPVTEEPVCSEFEDTEECGDVEFETCSEESEKRDSSATSSDSEASSSHSKTICSWTGVQVDKIIHFRCSVCCDQPVVIQKNELFQRDGLYWRFTEQTVPVCGPCVRKIPTRRALTRPAGLTLIFLKPKAKPNSSPRDVATPVSCSICCNVDAVMAGGCTYFKPNTSILYRCVNLLTCICHRCLATLRKIRYESTTPWHHFDNCVCTEGNNFSSDMPEPENYAFNVGTGEDYTLKLSAEDSKFDESDDRSSASETNDEDEASKPPQLDKHKQVRPMQEPEPHGDERETLDDNLQAHEEQQQIHDPERPVPRHKHPKRPERPLIPWEIQQHFIPAVIPRNVQSRDEQREIHEPERAVPQQEQRRRPERPLIPWEQLQHRIPAMKPEPPVIT